MQWPDTDLVSLVERVQRRMSKANEGKAHLLGVFADELLPVPSGRSHTDKNEVQKKNPPNIASASEGISANRFPPIFRPYLYSNPKQTTKMRCSTSLAVLGICVFNTYYYSLLYSRLLCESVSETS